MMPPSPPVPWIQNARSRVRSSPPVCDSPPTTHIPKDVLARPRLVLTQVLLISGPMSTGCSSKSSRTRRRSISRLCSPTRHSHLRRIPPAAGDGVHVRADESSKVLRLRNLVPVEVEGREELVVERVHLWETRTFDRPSCVDRQRINSLVMYCTAAFTRRETARTSRRPSMP